ncbi:hypothetical protein AA14337_2535 [Acetobacter malorum DSM 14337]|uniref:Uncharacterized protein n=1 Tax=Acetobacter malorum DSM 14337 TaxID=1307910 RepID=A0ABQ0PW87_9PROT|nr:hypothetical protein AD930_09575 [Acetobacter malorum]GBQ83213.1 hypothetical protein AA14337_2535 [Acetobacter malorum DSM 14337]
MMMLRKTLWPALAVGALLAVTGAVFLPPQSTQTVLYAFSDATACLFQYDVTQPTLEVASR